ncbi:MAG: hypothetical protein WD176_07265 [Pirellulales bacterium]
MRILYHIAALLSCVAAICQTFVPNQSLAAPPDQLLATDFTRAVDKRIEASQPRDEEKRFDQIGWSTEIVAAERLAKEHSRPVFLFTHDGRMGVGRC